MYSKSKELYTKVFEVRSFDVDFKGRLKPAMFLQYFQDVAGLHASILGVSLEELLKQNKTWVLSRNHLKIFRIPGIGETLQARTWPSGKIDLFALREFELIDRNETMVAAITSSWMILDLQTKRPVRLDRFIENIPVIEKRLLEDDFAALPGLDAKEVVMNFRVRMSDLDMNKHVNNVSYVNWALETIPVNVLWSFYPMEIEIAYKAEVFHGDEINCQTQQRDTSNHPVFLHQQLRQKDGKEIARLRTRWIQA